VHTIIGHAVICIVPVIMLLTFGAGVLITQRSGDDFRVSARAGLCAGLVAFAIYVASSSFSEQTSIGGPIKLPGFHWIPLAAGAVVGFGMLLLVDYLKLAAGLVGLFVLFLIASSSIAEFSYFFSSPLRDFAIDFSLSTLFGMLLNIILFPGTTKKLRGGGADQADESGQWTPRGFRSRA
jgi:hypothetical protein